MSSPIRLTREEIKKLVFGIRSLDDAQRPVVREALERLAHSSDAHVSPEELRKELRRLRESHQISETDSDGILRAIFP